MIQHPSHRASRGRLAHWVAAALAGTLAACATQDHRSLPPPPAVQALAGARSQVYRLAGVADAASAVAEVCSTTAGHCPVPAGTPVNLRCTCEAPDGSYTYAGRTGSVPPMPSWADPARRP